MNNNNNDDTNMTEHKQEMLDLTDRLQELNKIITEHQSKTPHETDGKETEEGTGEVKQKGRDCRANNKDETIAGLTIDIGDLTLINIMYKVLSNQFDYDYLVDSFADSADTPCDLLRRDPIMMDMAGQVIKNIYYSFSQLISIQPMDGPISLVDIMKAKTKCDEYGSTSILESVTVKAHSRKLQVGWTVEAMQDLNARRGMTFKSEIVRAMSQLITVEVANEILGDLRKLGRQTTGEWKDYVDPQFVYEFADGAEILRQIQTRVKQIKKNVHHKIKHNDKFFAVIGPVVLSYLQCSGEVKYVPNENTPHKFNTLPVIHVGTLDENIDIYVDVQMMKNDVLVGYKGRQDAITGYVYAPYVPIMCAGVVVNPSNFEPVVKFMTLYGKHIPKTVDGYADEAQHFYSTFTVEYNPQFVPPKKDSD